MLIDLDRGKRVTEPVGHLSDIYPNSVMYKSPTREWNAGMLDWLQFGYVIAYCHQDVRSKEYHVMTLDADVKRDPFISKLIFEGYYGFLYLDNHRITVCCYCYR